MRDIRETKKYFDDCDCMEVRYSREYRPENKKDCCEKRYDPDALYYDREDDDRYDQPDSYQKCHERKPKCHERRHDCDDCCIECKHKKDRRCPCQSTGEMVVNGGMEAFNNVPIGWTTTTPGAVSPVSAQGRVHSGNFAVNLRNGATLTQRIRGIEEDCFYEFSFFARGEGAQVGLTARVIFETTGGDVIGATITVRQQDLINSNRDFAYFRVITIAAPPNVTAARIEFVVTANGQQSLDLDDVSFSVA